MKLSVQQLRNCADRYLVEPTDAGFVILKTPKTDAAAFDALVRDAIDSSGQEFVALPRTDGWAGYDGVFIIPFDDRPQL